MSVTRGFALSALAALVGLGLAGCDSTQQREVKIEEYKFVNDVSGLTRSPNEEGIVVYDREGVDFAGYDKFIIYPVKVVYNNEDMRNLD